MKPVSCGAEPFWVTTWVNCTDTASASTLSTPSPVNCSVAFPVISPRMLGRAVWSVR